MAINLQTAPDPSMTSLVTGILDDAQQLMKQQMALFKHELQADLQKTKEAALSSVLGLGILCIGALLLCEMLVYLLHWAIPGLALWGSYAIVGVILTSIGGVLLFLGKQKIEEISPVPEQTVEGLKENVQWTTNRK